MLKYLVTSVLLVASFVNAQDFVFVSSRLQIDTDLSLAEDWQKTQNELFLYKNGSEIRLTYSNDLKEYDPSISPNGKLIAYVASSWVYPNELENSSWQVIVSDLRGRQIASFPLPNTQSEMRPAGGFSLAWLANSSGFFGNSYKKDSYDWDIYFFDINNKSSKKVAEGFMPALNPNNNLLASYLNNEVRIFDLSLDESWSVFEGVPLAWYDDTNIFVQNDDGLYLVDVYSAELPDLIYDVAGIYEYFVVNDSREYAFALRSNDANTTGSSLHKFVKRDTLIEVQLDGIVTGLSFLADGSLVYSLQNDFSDQIYKINEHATITPLVSSFGSDYSPQGFNKKPRP